ncbi:MAG TPA: hypothetical protein DCM08_02555 [Microscillaceae bacterium]|nr:hypothetical protein [Microscillaceae bacterium]
MKSYYKLLAFLLFLSWSAVAQEVSIETTTTAVADLQLTSMCSDKPLVDRRWRIRNPNSFSVSVRWEVYGTSQTGTVTAPAGDSFFTTTTVGGTSGHPNTTKIYWTDGSIERSTVKASGGAQCQPTTPPPPASCFAAEVVSFVQGPAVKGRKVATDRSNPARALGKPQGADARDSFVSLGFGGTLILKFADAIINGKGNDLRVTETSFGNPTCTKYPEKVEVWASQDNKNWVRLGEGCLDSEYDLGSLQWAQFVKLVDVSNEKDFGNDGDGFDVDGIECLNGSMPVPPPPVNPPTCEQTVGGSENPMDWNTVTLLAKTWDDQVFKSSNLEFSKQNRSTTDNGVGVKGGRFPEVDYDGRTGKAEVLRVDLRKEFTSAKVTFKRFYGQEGTNRRESETAHWIAYNAQGTEVGRGIVEGILPLNTDGTLEFTIAPKAYFQVVDLVPGAYIEARNLAMADEIQSVPDNSDFLLHKIVPDCLPIELVKCGDEIGGSGVPLDWKKVRLTGLGFGDTKFTPERVAYTLSGSNNNSIASGVGIKGGSSTVIKDNIKEIELDSQTGVSEVLRADFNDKFSEVEITLALFYGSEFGPNAEQGNVRAFDGDTEVGALNVTSDGDLLVSGKPGFYTFRLKTDKPFNRLEFRAGSYAVARTNGLNDEIEQRSTANRGDYILHKIVPICEPPVVAQTADLKVELFAKTQSYFGDTESYSLRVTNLGPDNAGDDVNAAKAVQLRVNLPSALEIVSFDGVWLDQNTVNLGAIAKNTSKSIEIRAFSKAVGTFPINASVSVAAPADPNLANNVVNANVNIVRRSAPQCKPDVAIAITQFDEAATKGDDLLYALEVTNLGDIASNVTINCQLPDGLTFLSASTDRGEFWDQSMSWNLGEMAKDAKVYITVIATSSLTGDLTTMFSVSSTPGNSCGQETNLENNQVQATTQVNEATQSPLDANLPTIQTLSATSVGDALKVFPVPFDNQFTVEFPEGFNGTVTVRILSSSNAVVFSKATDVSADSRSLVVDMPSTTSPGLYFVEVNYADLSKAATSLGGIDNVQNNAQRKVIKVYKK